MTKLNFNRYQYIFFFSLAISSVSASTDPGHKKQSIEENSFSIPLDSDSQEEEKEQYYSDSEEDGFYLGLLSNVKHMTSALCNHIKPNEPVNKIRTTQSVSQAFRGSMKQSQAELKHAISQTDVDYTINNTLINLILSYVINESFVGNKKEKTISLIDKHLGFYADFSFFMFFHGFLSILDQDERREAVRARRERYQNDIVARTLVENADNTEDARSRVEAYTMARIEQENQLFDSKEKYQAFVASLFYRLIRESGVSNHDEYFWVGEYPHQEVLLSSFESETSQIMAYLGRLSNDEKKGLVYEILLKSFINYGLPLTEEEIENYFNFEFNPDCMMYRICPLVAYETLKKQPKSRRL